MHAEHVPTTQIPCSAGPAKAAAGKLSLADMFPSMSAFQAVIAQGAPRRSSASSSGEEVHNKGETLVLRDCQDPIQSLAYERMMGKALPLAYTGVTSAQIRSAVYQ